jgi:hypothetical protein
MTEHYGVLEHWFRDIQRFRFTCPMSVPTLKELYLAQPPFSIYNETNSSSSQSAFSGCRFSIAALRGFLPEIAKKLPSIASAPHHPVFLSSDQTCF